jgi:hypothetical protein
VPGDTGRRTECDTAAADIGRNCGAPWLVPRSIRRRPIPDSSTQHTEIIGLFGDKCALETF